MNPVEVDPKKMVIENPGNIRTGKKQMFNLINIGERAGSGVPDIYTVWRSHGWEEPVVEEQYGSDRTILTLPLTKKVAVKKWR